MAVTLVQWARTGENGSASATVTPASAVTAGNTLVCQVQLYSQDGGANEIDMAATNPISDTRGNTWNFIPAAEVKQPAESWYQHQYFAYASNVAAGATTVTLNFQRSTWNWATLWEITPAQYDKALTGTGVGGSMNIGSLTPSANGAFLMLGAQDNDQPGWTVNPTPWTSDIADGAGGGQNATQHYAQTTAGPVTCYVTPAGTIANHWSITTVSFIPPGTTYTDSPSGQLLLGGSAVQIKVGNDTLTGAVLLSGSAVETKTGGDAPLGGVLFGGTMSQATVGADTPAGNLLWSGGALDAFTESYAPTGQLIIGGVLGDPPTNVDSVTGTLVLGGSVVEHYLPPGTSSAPSYVYVRYYTGDPDVPRDVQNLRRSNHETMRWMGTPVLLKHIYDIEDVEHGLARLSPTMDTIYEQSPYVNDQLSHGVGYVSVATQDGEWYDPVTGTVYISAVNPDPSYLPAPRYRGYGQGYLTYAVMPDRPEDVLHFTEQGTLIRSQTALVQLPWWPEMGDNDLLIEVELNPNGTVAKTYERYQLKQVTPITLRGMDRSGRREFPSTAGGNRYWVGQQAELVRVPPGPNEPAYQVETDR